MLPIVKQYTQIFSLMMASNFAGRHNDGANAELSKAVENLKDNGERIPSSMKASLIKFLEYHTKPGGALTGKNILPKTIKKFVESGDKNTADILKAIMEHKSAKRDERELAKFFAEWFDIHTTAVKDLRDHRRSFEAQEVLEDLDYTATYLRAYNETYGQKDRLISNKNGIYGIISQMSYPDSQALAEKLGIGEEQLNEFASKVGLSTGRFNDKAKEGLLRMALIAGVSLLLSGGAGLAIELFGINYRTDYKDAPTIDSIRELFQNARTSKIDSFNKKFRKFLLSNRVTPEEVEMVGDRLNDEELIPNNLRKYIDKIFGNNDFQRLLRFVFGGEYNNMQVKINEFQQSPTVEMGEAILREIYAGALEETRTNRDGWQDVSGYVELDKIAAATSIFVNLRAKKHQLLAKRHGLNNEQSFVYKRYRQETATIQKEITQYDKKLNVTRRPSVRTLESFQAYGPALPEKMNKNTMSNLYYLLKGTIIEGREFSVLADVMRGIKEHYGIDFSVQEFKEAFINMKYLGEEEKDEIAEKFDQIKSRKDFDEKLASNTGFNRNQIFQGKIKPTDKVAVMIINGTQVFLKDACMNVLPVIRDLDTTVSERSSIPFAPFVGVNWTGGILGKITTRPGVRGGGTGGGGNGTPIPGGNGR